MGCWTHVLGVERATAVTRARVLSAEDVLNNVWVWVFSTVSNGNWQHLLRDQVFSVMRWMPGISGLPPDAVEIPLYTSEDKICMDVVWVSFTELDDYEVIVHYPPFVLSARSQQEKRRASSRKRA